MKKGQHKVFSANHSVFRAVMIGALITTGISLLLTALLTSLILNGRMGEGSTNSLIFLIRALAVFVGSLIATSIKKEKHLYTIALVSLTYFIILSGICILSYEGTFQNILSGIASIAIGGLITWLIRMKATQKGRTTAKYSI